MDATLIVVGGKATKGTIPVKPPIVIGRGKEADLILAHRTISRRHAELLVKDGGLVIRDLGSLNGTFVNGEPITEAALPSGAELTIGPLTFRIEYERDRKQQSIKPSSTAEGGPKPSASVAPPAEAKFELPDFEPINEAPAKQRAANAPTCVPAADEEVARSPADAFDDLLNELL